MFTVAWLDARRRNRRDLQVVRGLLAANVNEQIGLRAQLDAEIRRHSDTLEHLRLMSKDNERLTFQVELYRRFFEATVPDPYETDL